jgi:hypothetical protein
VSRAPALFISYAHRDNCACTLTLAKGIAAPLGTPFADHLYDPNTPSSHELVDRELNRATYFAVIVTPSYLTTPWTRWEYKVARDRDVVLFEIHLAEREIRPSTAADLEAALALSTGIPRCCWSGARDEAS